MFANLTQADKEAFFALLDEYFASRPHLLGGQADVVAAAAPAAAALGTAMARNPQATANLVSAGARTFNKFNNPNHASSPSVSASPASSVEPEHSSSASFGRVAAAAANLSSKGLSRFGGNPLANQSAPAAASPPPAPPAPAPVVSTRPGASSSPAPPPPAPRRAPSSASSSSGTGPAGLVSTRAIGDVNTSSGKAVFASILPKRHFPGPAPTAVAVPAAFAKPKNNFAPPPSRSSAIPTPEPEPEAEQVTAPVEDGEWAEALYEYESADPGDLPLRDKQRVRIVERTSDDWWTGESEGRRGLFPSAYVQLV